MPFSPFCFLTSSCLFFFQERAFRSILKTYRSKLTTEVTQITKAVQKHKRRFHEQTAEFDKQERQLIAWGLKGAIQKFHMQAWFRLERCKLQEKLTVEIEHVITQRQSKSIEYLQQFEDFPSNERKEKFTVKGAEEFCQTPEALIFLDSSILSLHERLKKLDLLCTYATRQFLLLEPEFAWKDTKKRSKILHTILNNYNLLPKINDLVNIEEDLPWEQFCTWCAVRTHKLRGVEQDYSDFIEDQRELEGRLFFRWHSSVMLTIKTNDLTSSPSSTVNTGNSLNVGTNPASEASYSNSNNGIITGIDPEQLKSRPTALRVTPASIKAFIRYFATEIIGIKYEIPKDCITAAVALTESLFYRRLSSYVFRYTDKSLKERDDIWRLQSQKCRYVNPSIYHVPLKYYKGKHAKSDPESQEKEKRGSSSSPVNHHHHHSQVSRLSVHRDTIGSSGGNDIDRMSSLRQSVDFPSYSSFERKSAKNQTSSSSSKTPSTPFIGTASFALSPASRESEIEKHLGNNRSSEARSSSQIGGRPSSSTFLPVNINTMPSTTLFTPPTNSLVSGNDGLKNDTEDVKERISFNESEQHISTMTAIEQKDGDSVSEAFPNNAVDIVSPPIPSSSSFSSSHNNRNSRNLTKKSSESSSSTTPATSPLPPPLPSPLHPTSHKQIVPGSPAKPRGVYYYCQCQYCQTFSLSLRLQKFPSYDDGKEDGKSYARASRVLSWMNTAITPRVSRFVFSILPFSVVPVTVCLYFSFFPLFVGNDLLSFASM
jgi:hypothetical protein